MFSNGDIYDGYFRQGLFEGLGVYFKFKDSKWLYGMFKNNECVEIINTGDGFPFALIRKSQEFIDLVATNPNCIVI